MVSAFLLFICVAILLWSPTESMKCFGWCGRKATRKRATKRHVSPGSISVNPFDAVNARKQSVLLNFLNGTHLHSSRVNSITIPEASRLPVPQSRNRSFNASSRSTDISHDVHWFDVDHHYITQNNSIIRSNLYTILLNVMMYDLTHVSYWLAHYLPLRNCALARQYQTAFDYFAQFQYGVDHVNLRRFVRNFESIRETVVHLSTFLNEPTDLSDAVTPCTHIGFDARAKRLLGETYRHRKRMKQVRAFIMRKRTRGSDATPWSESTMQALPEHFWNTDWLKWNNQPQTFSGLDRNETHDTIEVILYRVSIAMDRVHEIITGYDDKESGIPSLQRMATVKKGTDIFIDNYFFKSVYQPPSHNTVNGTRVRQTMLIRFMSLPDKQKKLVMSLHQVVFSQLKFVLTTYTSKVSKRKGNPQTRLNPNYFKQSGIQCIQLQFAARLFGGRSSWMSRMKIINRFLVSLLEDEYTARSLGFKDIERKGGPLFLLNTVLQAAMLGGRCGYAYNGKDVGYEASLICEVPLMNPTNITEQFRMPRRFAGKGNDTEEYWSMLEDFTKLSFQEMEDEDESRDTPDEFELEEMVEHLGGIPHRKSGLTMDDLFMHNFRLMQTEDREEDYLQNDQRTMNSFDEMATIATIDFFK